MACIRHIRTNISMVAVSIFVSSEHGVRLEHYPELVVVRLWILDQACLPADRSGMTNK